VRLPPRILDGSHRRANGENHPTSKSDGSPRVCGCIARIGRTARSVCFGRAWFSLGNAIRKYGIMYFVERVDLSQRASDFVSNGLRRALSIFGFLAYAFKFHIPRGCRHWEMVYHGSSYCSIRGYFAKNLLVVMESETFQA